MRALTALLFLAAPAQAWEFTSVPICTIMHDTADLGIRVTYDPARSEPYEITLTRTGTSWPTTETFGLRFDGPAAMTIGTSRQTLSPDGRSLTVTDTGFDNVLDGLALNATAAALAGDTIVPFGLDGARPVVEAFRSCGVAPSA
ncbi:excinuclease ABC subunit B [Tabrizicola sp.]|uniref:excinuclease ABC subunit B n=1 Tax=Tabrizicola sp. TaxID=2005166 RepID=UPI003F35EBDF